MEMWGSDSQQYDGRKLSLAVDVALSYLTPNDERAIREHFGLQSNPQLEDVIVGEWASALAGMPREAVEILRAFL